MNLILLLNQFGLDNIYFSDSIKNTVIENSNFIRIYYSTSLFTLNGVLLLIPFLKVKIESHFNKFKYIFDINSNQNIIDILSQTEMNILSKININKIPKSNITNQLKCGFIKLFTANQENHSQENHSQENHSQQNGSDTQIDYFYLKISGIWETTQEYGLTFKFIENTIP